MKLKIPEKLKIAAKIKYLLPALVIVCALLLLLPQTGGESAAVAEDGEQSAAVSVESEEARLEKTLCEIRGAGKVKVLLSQEDSGERVFAESEDEVLVVSAGSGTQEPVERYTRSMRYRGAVVVCEGADSAEVRLKITEAVMVFTGLGSDKISVFSMD